MEYRNIQFTKTEAVLRGMGLDGTKSEKALAEFGEKGLAPGPATAAART